MKIALNVDYKLFRKGLRLKAAAVQKSEHDLINKAGKDVGFRAAQFTPRARASAISAELSKNANELAVKILSKRGRFRGVRIKDRKKIVRKFISARRRSAGYIRSGWGPAIAAFGGKATRLNPKSEAAKGYGRKATKHILKATLVNNAKGAEKVARKPLQRALNFVGDDMRRYAMRKMLEKV